MDNASINWLKKPIYPFIIATANIRKMDGKGTIECDIHPLAISIQRKQNEMVARSYVANTLEHY